ncbi:MAG: hypothetical protein U0903_20695 [Planctomycetales bacterium]
MYIWIFSNAHVDDETDLRPRFFRRTDFQALRRIHQPPHELIMHRIQHDHPRTRRALLTRISERTVDHPLHRFIQIRIVVDNDRSSPSRRSPSSRSPARRRSRPPSVESTAPSSVDNHVHLRMLHQHRPDLFSHPRQKVHHSRRQVNLFQITPIARTTAAMRQRSVFPV